jgi:RimJ/RimL family protein N-acetyltransferase
MLGCGHGSAFLRVVGARLLAEGAPIVAIDPDCDNHRARRAYRRAGFVEESIGETVNGAVVVMLLSQLVQYGKVPGGGPTSEYVGSRLEAERREI